MRKAFETPVLTIGQDELEDPQRRRHIERLLALEAIKAQFDFTPSIESAREMGFVVVSSTAQPQTIEV